MIAIQQICKRFLRIIFDKNICRNDLCLHNSKNENVTMFYHMSKFVSTEHYMYFLPAGLECDADVFVVNKIKAFTIKFNK